MSIWDWEARCERAAEEGRAIFAVLVANLALFLLGCAGSQAKSEAASDASREESAASGSIGPTAQDLQPADAPPDIVLRFRASRLPALLDSVFQAASIPYSWRDAIAEDEQADRLARIIDADGTIEGALALNPRVPTRPMGFTSLGVTGIDPVLEALDAKRIEVQEGPGGAHYFLFEGQACAVGHAISGSSARVVCSDTREHLSRMLGYALRGLPREVLSEAAVHVEFDMEPVRRRYGAEFKTYLRWTPALARTMHMGNPTFDRALSDGALLVADEATALIDELDTITGQLFVDQGDFRLVVQARLVGEGSQTVKTLHELSKRAGDVPEIFDRLPSTASAAVYTHEIPEERAKAWWSILADLARGSAELEKCSRPFSQRLGRVVSGFGSKGAVKVIARGPLVTSSVDGSSAGGRQRIHPAWSLTGTTQPSKDVIALLDDVAYVLASPELKNLIDDSAEFPEFKRTARKVPGAPKAQVYSWKLSNSAQTLARILGAQMPADLGIEDPEKMVAGLETEEGLFAVYELGKHTWMSWGRSVEEIGEAFRALEAKDSERLGDLGALDGVRSEPAVSAGYSQLAGLFGAFGWALPDAKLDSWEEIRRATPHRGAVPMTYFFKVNAGRATEATWELRLPAEFVQDLAMAGYIWSQEAETPKK